MNKKTILISSAILLLIVAFIAKSYYSKIYDSNVKESSVVYIPTGTTIYDLETILSPLVKDIDDFIWVANKKKYAHRIKSGRFELSKGLNNNDLLDLLRSGKQSPIQLSFNNQHLLENLAGRISEQIEADSIALLTAFTDKKFLEENNFNIETALAMYIPNSYEVYWNTSAEGFRNKMLREYKSYWNANRLKKAKAQNLTPIEAISLAAIVQKETATISERPTVAGLYLNRLHNNWPLQSDPTIIFALKQKNGQDFEVKRVLTKDLQIESPYNTYKLKGVPPGPIAMPDISSIEAVLSPKKHKYFYMCASVENFGSHAFARSLAQHNRNARKYQSWLSKQGVNR